jgi:hypothetical protein
MTDSSIVTVRIPCYPETPTMSQGAVGYDDKLLDARQLTAEGKDHFAAELPDVLCQPRVLTRVREIVVNGRGKGGDRVCLPRRSSV